MTMPRAATAVLETLATGELVVEGRIAGASNATLLASAGGDLACVYKPVRGERPLWDFPDWTLARRELAAYALSETACWHVVPATAWREDGPAGEGMCQEWIESDPDAAPVGVVRPGRAPGGWRHVLDASDGAGRDVQLVHADTVALQRIAVFDVLANNADRKGGHLLADAVGRVWAIDHGVTFAIEPKLRTVLWGWAGEPVPQPILDEVAALATVLGAGYDPVDRWLDDGERDRLRRRIQRFLERGVFPSPSGRWPAIPWPVF